MLLLNKKDRFALNPNDNKRMQSIGSIETRMHMERAKIW